jgi:hypothetical protein
MGEVSYLKVQYGLRIFIRDVDASAVLPITVNTARGDAHDYVIQ